MLLKSHGKLDKGYYIPDSGGNRIRMVNIGSGIISTIVGGGISTFNNRIRMVNKTSGINNCWRRK